MKLIADVAQDAGAETYGVSVEFLRDKARKNATEMFIAKDLSERKAKMESRADAFLILPGGIGTLDEVTEIIEHKKHAVHKKPIVFYSIGGFYSGFRDQLNRMEKDGFLTSTVDDFVAFIEKAEELPAALNYLAATTDTQD
jgi:uncharacterized protein (TIGR00730 family)